MHKKKLKLYIFNFLINCLDINTFSLSLFYTLKILFKFLLAYASDPKGFIMTFHVCLDCNLIASLPLLLLHVPSVLGEALPEFRCHHHHHTAVLVHISSTSSPSLVGSRRRGCRRAVRVLNTEVPLVRYLDQIGSRREYDYTNSDL